MTRTIAEGWEAHVPDGWDELAAALNARGVHLIAPTRPTVPISDDAELFLRLWSSDDPRLRESAVGLLLVRPDLSDAAAETVERLEGRARGRATMAYVAASALQRMWRTRLALAVGARPLLPPRYLEHWSLPSLETDYGERTLSAVADLEEDAFGYDAWAGYHRLMEQLLGELDALGISA